MVVSRLNEVVLVEEKEGESVGKREEVIVLCDQVEETVSVREDDRVGKNVNVSVSEVVGVVAKVIVSSVPLLMGVIVVVSIHVCQGVRVPNVVVSGDAVGNTVDRTEDEPVAVDVRVLHTV